MSKSNVVQIPYLDETKNHEAEQTVIAAMVDDSDACMIALDRLTKDEFYSEPIGEIFAVIGDLVSQAQSIDPVTVNVALDQNGKLDFVGGPTFLFDLVMNLGSAKNINYWIQTVKDKALQRRAVKKFSELAVIAKGKITIPDLFAKIENETADLMAQQVGQPVSKISDLTKEEIAKIKIASQQNNSTVTGITTGFADLDYKTNGFQNSDLVLIAGRPSHGKTALALNMVYAAAKAGEIPLVFSLEMAKDKLTRRLISARSSIDSQTLQSGQLSLNQWEDLAMAEHELTELKIYIDDSPKMTFEAIKAKTRLMIAKNNITQVVIDYMGLIDSTTTKWVQNRVQEVSNLSRGLKLMAKEFKIPVILLCQLNREIENRPLSDRRPKLSDLRESGSLEQDADVIMFVWREELFNPKAATGTANVAVEKNREGPTGIVKLTFLKEYTRFENHYGGPEY